MDWYRGGLGMEILKSQINTWHCLAEADEEAACVLQDMLSCKKKTSQFIKQA